jgi:enoyl-CoA hydratase
VSFLLPSIADSLGRDDEYERTLYYITMGTEEKVRGVNGFLKKK